MNNSMTIDELVQKIRRDAGFWAPEVRVQNLVAHLNMHGSALYDRLRELPAEEREDIGIDRVRIIGRSK